jgi:hypothetical protein
VSASNVQPGKTSNLRRSQRVCVSVDVVVLWRKANNDQASEQAKTLMVNADGALIPLRSTVRIDQLLTLRNAMTMEELSCRVVDLSSVDKLGLRSVGVEFVEPAPRFWHIAFPPRDWTPRSPEAKSYKRQSDSGPKTTSRN